MCFRWRSVRKNLFVVDWFLEIVGTSMRLHLHGATFEAATWFAFHTKAFRDHCTTALLKQPYRITRSQLITLVEQQLSDCHWCRWGHRTSTCPVQCALLAGLGLKIWLALLTYCGCSLTTPTSRLCWVWGPQGDFIGPDNTISHWRLSEMGFELKKKTQQQYKCSVYSTQNRYNMTEINDNWGSFYLHNCIKVTFIYTKNKQKHVCTFFEYVKATTDLKLCNVCPRFHDFQHTSSGTDRHWHNFASHCAMCNSDPFKLWRDIKIDAGRPYGD